MTHDLGKSDRRKVCAGQRTVQVGESPTQPETTGWYPKAGVMTRRPAVMSEDRVSVVRRNPKGMRRITRS